MVVKAIVKEADKLTKIAFASKAFWGYSQDLINSWVNDLTVTQEMIINRNIYNYIVNDEVVGFYILNSPEHNNCELEMLFVLPKFIGKGIGKKLLTHAIEKANSFKVNSITLLADPNAVAFYKSQGFTIIDKKESAIPGRFLPVMKIDLKL